MDYYMLCSIVPLLQVVSYNFVEPSVCYCGVPSCEIAKECIDTIRKTFKETYKPKIRNLPSSFFNVQYDNTGEIWNYILRIFQLARGFRW